MVKKSAVRKSVVRKPAARKSAVRKSALKKSVLVLGDVQVDAVVVRLPANLSLLMGNGSERSATVPAGGTAAQVAGGAQPAGSTTAGAGDHPRQNWQDAPQYLMFQRPGGAWLVGEVVRAALESRGMGAETKDGSVAAGDVEIQVAVAGAKRAQDGVADLIARCPI
ncbi:MAG TPA: hypothetical protein VHG28_00315, partial [Longimicrobiaceae bacterium]|nr:hypothetical protein [Longimicrobiaceae bacterium]